MRDYPGGGSPRKPGSQEARKPGSQGYRAAVELSSSSPTPGSRWSPGAIHGEPHPGFISEITSGNCSKWATSGLARFAEDAGGDFADFEAGFGEGAAKLFIGEITGLPVRQGQAE